ncbi:MAG: SusD/RagB family nutrient-binding outer membrane lipoprotein [Bacteroidales bacterium]|nr:SusD/RagB family nutrient-binding outer membrane lipoprotein [Bacteroidales bacterium]
MTFNKISISLISVLCLSLITSCSEDKMDEINEDINHTTKVPAQFILPDLITSTAFNNLGGDANTYISTYIEHQVGIHNQLWNAETRANECILSTTFNNLWINIYSTLRNAKTMINFAEETQDIMQKGMAEIMVAYNLGLLTDYFGDAPWTEACDYENFKAPKVDSQEEIYNQIFSLLDQGIEDLNSQEGNNPHSYDFLYDGNTKNWIKFANGLKARYKLHLLNKSSDKNATLEDILKFIDNSFKSADEQASFKKYDDSNLNPLFDFEWSRDGIAASQSLYNKLAERNDPRAQRCFVDCNDWYFVTEPQSEEDADGVLPLAPNGTPRQVQYEYLYNVFLYAQTAPTHFLSYHELLFIKAEVLCRLGRIEEAEQALKDGILASFINTEISINSAIKAPQLLAYGGLDDTDIQEIPTCDEDFDNWYPNNISELYYENPLKEIMIQKYLAFWGANGESIECYNDYRRLISYGEGDIIKLDNPLNASKFPQRLPYGNADVTNNHNIKVLYGDGNYVWNKKIWWAE